MEISASDADHRPDETSTMRLDPGDPAAFAAAMGELMTHRARDGTGRVDVLQKLDLEALQEHFGEDWGRVRNRALVMEEQLVEQALGPDDRFFWASPTELFILRVNGKETPFAEKLDHLVRALTAKLCGSDGPKRLPTVEQVVTRFARALDGIETVEALLERYELLRARARDKAMWAELAPMDEFVLAYLPILHFKKRLIGVYQAVPLIKHADGRTEPAVNSAGNGDHSRFEAELDRWMLDAADKVIGQAQQSVNGGIVLPLHYSTMTQRRFCQPYLECCLKLAPRTRKHLILQIKDLPYGMKAAQIRDLTAYIRTFCAALVIDQTHGFVEPRDLLTAGIRIIGLDAEGASHQEQTARKINELGRRVHGTRLRAFIYNLSDLRLSRLAVEAGFTYFDGDAVMPMVAKPSRIIRVRR